MRGRLNRSWLAVVEVLSDQRIPTVLQMLASNKTSNMPWYGQDQRGYPIHNL